jgi:hypothetical protein
MSSNITEILSSAEFLPACFTLIFIIAMTLAAWKDRTSANSDLKWLVLIIAEVFAAAFLLRAIFKYF